MTIDKETVEKAAENTDRELWREEDDNYAPSIHVTAQGAISMNVAVLVHVMPVRDWHGLPQRLENAEAALEWYAEMVADCRKHSAAGEFARGQLDKDGGERARTTLQEKQKAR